jgi:hypothetical protein
METKENKAHESKYSCHLKKMLNKLVFQGNDQWLVTISIDNKQMKTIEKVLDLKTPNLLVEFS